MLHKGQRVESPITHEQGEVILTTTGRTPDGDSLRIKWDSGRVDAYYQREVRSLKVVENLADREYDPIHHGEL